MTKSKNTNVTSLDYFSQLKVRKLATKCQGSCGACDFTGCYGQVECAMIVSEGRDK